MGSKSQDGEPFAVQQDAGGDKICRSPGNNGKSSRQEPGPRKGEGPETMKTGLSTALDPNRRSSDGRDVDNRLRVKMVGQDQAVETVVETYNRFVAVVSPPGRA